MHVDARSDGGASIDAVRARGGPTPEVVRSRARRRTSSASVRDGRVVVRIPAHLSSAAEAATVDGLVQRLHARAATPAPHTSLPERVPARPTRQPRGPRGDALLVERADAVAARWLADEGSGGGGGGAGVRAASATWSHRMTTRWASVTTPPGRIRISHRLADAPDEVLDVLLLHELAHILHPGHGPAFRTLAGRDPNLAAVDAWLARRSHQELRAALGLA